MKNNELIRKIILTTINEMGKEDGMVKITDFYDYLKESHKIDRITAGKLIIKLYREGELYSPKNNYVKMS